MADNKFKINYITLAEVLRVSAVSAPRDFNSLLSLFIKLITDLLLILLTLFLLELSIIFK